MQLTTMRGRTADLCYVGEAINDSLRTVGELQDISYRFEQSYLSCHVECQVLVSDFNQIWNFSTDFCVNPQHQISRKFAQLQQRR